MAEDTMPLFRGDCKFYVYTYRDPRPRKKNAVIYVGKGLAKNSRADDHWRNKNGKSFRNRLFKGVLDKIQAAGLMPVIEIVGWFADELAALDHEKCLIAQFGRRRIGTGTLCNLTDGGEGVCGYKPSEETIAKIRAKVLGQKRQPHTEETKRKIGTANAIALKGRKCPEHSVRMTGRKQSPEVVAKRAAKQIGQVRSNEAKARMSAAQKGHAVSDEARKNMSLAHLGKKQSQDAIENRRVSLREAWARRRTPEYLANTAAGLKKCCTCKEWKPVDAFAKCKKNNDGLNSLCRQCNSIRRRK